MARIKHTTSSFIEAARQIHSDTYDYSQVEFTTIRSPVEIVCKKHGPFMQDPYSHLKGAGCARCRAVTTVEDAIEKFNEVHSSKYDYRNFTTWTKSTAKIAIICPLHGEFTQSIADHLKGTGCPECGKVKKATALKRSVDHYIMKAREVHGNKYDYSQWGDGNVAWHQKVTIGCPIHGPFDQILGSHIKGSGCEKCGIESARVKSTNTLERNITKARGLFGEVYDYSEVPPDTSSTTPITLKCRIHALSFTTTWNQHLSSKVGCPVCSKERTQLAEMCNHGVTHHKQRHLGPNVVAALDDMDALIKMNHDDGMSLAEIAISIGCHPTTVHRRFVSNGVEVKTQSGTSTGEKQVQQYVASLVGDSETFVNTKQVIAPLELDIYIPSHNLAIEYCGLYWHSELFRDRSYHVNKLEMCQKRGIRLITIFEDEWVHKRELVEKKLSAILHHSNASTVYARSCSIIPLDNREKVEFFDANHIQGSGPGSVTYGLQCNDSIVAAMTFIKQRGGRWDLNRYATACNVPGGFTKLLKHFRRNNEWIEIVSFADRRWSEGGVYDRNGFTLDATLPPDYSYIINNKTVHKFNFRHSKLHRFLGERYDPTISEVKNMNAAGYYRIFNCGLLRYVMKNE